MFVNVTHLLPWVTFTLAGLHFTFHEAAAVFFVNFHDVDPPNAGVTSWISWGPSEVQIVLRPSPEQGASLTLTVHDRQGEEIQRLEVDSKTLKVFEVPAPSRDVAGCAEVFRMVVRRLEGVLESLFGVLGCIRAFWRRVVRWTYTGTGGQEPVPSE